MSAQPQGRLKPASVVYWLRFLLAVCAGLANHFLGITQAVFGDLAIFIGIGLGIAFYALSVLVVRDVLHYGEAELKGKNKYIVLGGGTFIFVWIMISVLVNTIF